MLCCVLSFVTVGVVVVAHGCVDCVVLCYVIEEGVQEGVCVGVNVVCYVVRCAY